MPLSKPFAIATEGKTIDGRTISRDWINQMADNYDPKVYTAVANLEHFLSSLPDSVFGAYGNVVSLSTREVEIMGDKKLQLMAVVDANDKLVSLQKAGQKCFASMEVLSDFIGKGVAYLSGLAFTNTPASIGTEAMKFSFAAAQGERYAFGDEIAIEFEGAKPDAGDALFAKVKGLLGLGEKKADERFADQAAAITALAESQKRLLEAYAGLQQAVAEFMPGKEGSVYAQLEAMKKDFAALKETLAKTDADANKRPTATGGDGQIKADC